MQPVFTPDEKKVIFFDLHDTLVDRQHSFYDALAECLNEFTARWHDETEWNGTRSVERYAKEWIKKTTSPHRGTKRTRSCSYEQKQVDCLRKSLKDSPFQLTDSFLRSVLKRTKELAPEYPRLFPDVYETLNKLKERYRLAIISNGTRKRLETTITRSGLNPLFEDSNIFVPVNRKRKKPHPDMFNKALHAMGISPSEAVMVGNSWKNDVFGANRCGLDAVWIRNTNNKTVQRRIGKNKVIFVSRCKQLVGLFE